MSEPHDHLRETELAPLVAEYGPLELDPAEDLFERFVVAVVNQMLSTESARAIRERLFDRIEVTPAGVLAADEAVLRDAGLSARKAEYVRNVARWFREEGVTRERFAGRDDAAVIAELTAITGVGDWTAKMVLLAGLGRPDVFPVEDLAVRRGMAELFGDEDRAAMRERAEDWRPYRSYGTLYVWQYYVDEHSSVAEPVL